MMQVHTYRKTVAGFAAVATLSLGVLAGGVPLKAQAASPSCTTPVTSAPTTHATVSLASSPFGKVLVVGSGPNAGCSLYVLTSDQLHALTYGLAAYACSDNPNVIGPPCDTTLWPALLTKGRPIAGPGVDRSLLGVVIRSDVLPGQSVQQVTYAGLPLYRFFLDETPGQTDGVNLFDPVTSPTGIWRLVSASGRPATGRASLHVESVGGSEVLSVSMDNDFSLLPHGRFPVYTRTALPGHDQACRRFCALIWPPVLTSGMPVAGRGVDQRALGVVVLPDGTQQVTYRGKPLYLFNNDAYIPGIIGTRAINGAGAVTPWGEFNTIALP
jgi:predicted lipoprotein with Yx(FWY)xxD motif